MQRTVNYNLKKPDATDAYNVEDANDNAEVIDKHLAAVEYQTLKTVMNTTVGPIGKGESVEISLPKPISAYRYLIVKTGRVEWYEDGGVFLLLNGNEYRISSMCSINIMKNAIIVYSFAIVSDDDRLKIYPYELCSADTLRITSRSDAETGSMPLNIYGVEAEV